MVTEATPDGQPTRLQAVEASFFDLQAAALDLVGKLGPGPVTRYAKRHFNRSKLASLDLFQLRQLLEAAARGEIKADP